MSMNQNDDIRYLDIGLPEDIARLKAVGDIDNALRLIDMHLADPNTTAPLAACMRVQREIMLRRQGTILTRLKPPWRAYARIFPILPRRSPRA